MKKKKEVEKTGTEKDKRKRVEGSEGSGVWEAVGGEQISQACRGGRSPLGGVNRFGGSVLILITDRLLAWRARQSSFKGRDGKRGVGGVLPANRCFAPLSFQRRDKRGLGF